MRERHACDAAEQTGNSLGVDGGARASARGEQIRLKIGVFSVCRTDLQANRARDDLPAGSFEGTAVLLP